MDEKEKVIITGKDVGVLSVVGMDLSDFKKLAKLDPKPRCDTDLIQCPVCKLFEGIKAWARFATKEFFVCPHYSCHAEIKIKMGLVVRLREIPKLEIESIETDTSSVEIRPDGTKLIKETLHVKVKSAAAKK